MIGSAVIKLNIVFNANVMQQILNGFKNKLISILQSLYEQERMMEKHQLYKAQDPCRHHY